MAESLFSKYRKEARGSGIKLRTKNSREWFRKNLKKIKTNPRELLKDSATKRDNTPFVGGMFMFFYDPKHRETLPYYDAFPLILMVEPTEDGFYGINLHYLSPVLRAKLFDALLETANNSKYDSSTRLRINYNILKSTQKLKAFEPCFKRYLTSQVQGNIVRVEPRDWELALFMPVEQFRKSSKTTVWSQSKKSF